MAWLWPQILGPTERTGDSFKEEEGRVKLLWKVRRKALEGDPRPGRCGGVEG